MSLRDFLAIATSGLRPAPQQPADEGALNKGDAQKSTTSRIERAPCEPCDLRFVLSL